MREFLVIALTSCAMFGSSVAGIGQETGARVTLPILPPLSGKWICVIEKAAGVLYGEGAKESTPQAVKFQEQNRRFVLTIRRIVRDQFERDFCRATLSHWMPILAEKGNFDPSDKEPRDGYDRFGIGPRCFASDEAVVKFFDRDHPDTLVRYDFWHQQWMGLPGQWLKFYANKFEAGETVDLGPVVFTGSCERID